MVPNRLGPLADNAAQLAGFVRRKLAFRDAAEEISEDVGAIVGRLQRPQRKVDRCSSAGGNSPIDQEASSVDVAVLGRSVEESVEQRIDVLDDLSIEAVPGLLGQSDGVGFRPPALVPGRRSVGSGRRFGYIVGHGETQLRARRNYSAAPSYVHAETIAPYH